MKELKETIENKIKRNFVIQYYNTQQNQSIIKTFILMCENESDNNWILGLKKLLESYSTDWKYASLYDDISELRQELAKLKNEKEKESPSKNRSVKTFGGKE